MDSSNILSIAAIVLVLIGYIITYFGMISKMQGRLVSLETKVDLFWHLVEEKMADLLHSPTNKVKDGLLDKLKANQISCEESIQLRAILEEESFNSKTQHLALAYYLTIAILGVKIENSNRR